MYIEKNFLKHTCSWNIDINFFVISIYVQEACWLNCQFFWMVNIKVLNKTMLQICILPSFSTTIFLKTRGPCATSLTWKKQFLVKFRYIAYVITILNFESLSGEPALVYCLWMALKESTLFEDHCIAVSQTVRVLLLKKTKFK